MTMILHNPQERSRFAKFAVVGAIGSVVDVLVMNLLTALAGASLVFAGSVSFVCAVASNFTWNRLWTYPESRSKPILGQLTQFAIVNAIGLIIRVPILTFGEPLLDAYLESLPLPATAQYHTFLSHNLTLAIAIGIVMLWNFFVNRYWTYNDVAINSPRTSKSQQE
ncbi:MAG: GtrA family protein [Anaerolineales bacterium]|jgi:putative flippase GtrA|nr:GtrA family protein [Anaerolineales bacterium]